MECGGNFLKDRDCLIFKQTVQCLKYGIFPPNGETEQNPVYHLALVSSIWLGVTDDVICHRYVSHQLSDEWFQMQVGNSASFLFRCLFLNSFYSRASYL